MRRLAAPRRRASSCGPREPDARELPARVRREEVAIRRAYVPARRRARAAAQDELVAHELAVVFAERAREGHEARIRPVRARRPLPRVAEDARAAARMQRARLGEIR